MKIIVDFYRLRQENEDLDILRVAQKDIVHFHFANPTGLRQTEFRMAPERSEIAIQDICAALVD